MLSFGQKLGAALKTGDVLFLRGDLGAGKTTLARGILLGLGHTGHVTSPTFTIVEPYCLAPLQIYHFDLYRLETAAELEAVGIRDMLDGSSICLFEWPEKARGLLPEPAVDIDIQFTVTGRELHMQTNRTLPVTS